MLQAGQYVYPFQFQIPYNLPPSIFHKMGDVRLDYRIRAQFIPHMANDWVDPDASLSCLRANDFYIQISRPLDQIIMNPDQIWRYPLVTTAHTFMGMGKVTETHTDFEFKQAMAPIGSRIPVRIVCDNSKCKKDVEKFVLRWYCMTTNRTKAET